jgi:hypothetical protein
LRVVPGIGGRGMKESSKEGEFRYDIFDIVITFANTPMYPHPAQQQ